MNFSISQYLGITDEEIVSLWQEMQGANISSPAELNNEMPELVQIQ